jgi:hypothetical protein
LLFNKLSSGLGKLLDEDLLRSLGLLYSLFASFIRTFEGDFINYDGD